MRSRREHYGLTCADRGARRRALIALPVGNTVSTDACLDRIAAELPKAPVDAVLAIGSSSAPGAQS